MRRNLQAAQCARRAAVLAFFLLVVLTMPGAPAIAQDNYPNRSVKIIAPQAPGGGVDLVARHALAVLRGLRAAPRVDLTALRG